MNTHTSRSLMGMISLALMAVAISLPTISMSGCSVWDSRPRLRKQKVNLNVSVNGVPPIRVGTVGEHHLLIMQAPNSGWSIAIDKTERISDGERIFITARRPDPSFMYPQAIVEKQLLTDIRKETAMEIYARVLGSDEKTKGRGFGRLTPVDAFEQ